MLLRDLKMTLLLLDWKIHITFGKHITHYEKNGDTFVYNGFLPDTQKRALAYGQKGQRVKLTKNFKSNQEAADFLSGYSQSEIKVTHHGVARQF